MNEEEIITKKIETKPLYICLACHKEMELRINEAIKCRACGFNILTKKRQRRPIVYDAI